MMGPRSGQAPLLDRPKYMPPSQAWSDLEGRETASLQNFFQAAEGTRTLDLLHGKQTYIEPMGRTSPCKSR